MAVRCTQSGCPVATEGKCREGFSPPDTCPYITYSEDDEIEVATTEPASTIYEALPSGEALSTSEVASITRSEPSKIIIFAGPIESGKTTILTSLYESYLEAPFANFLFAGSRTLVGFERRCHNARESSGRLEAKTSHTSHREGVLFLHLRLGIRDGQRVTKKTLLLSDISGEQFKKIRDSSDATKEMTILSHADHLCLVIDGEKLSNVAQRQTVRNETRLILRSIVEGNALSPKCQVDVVFAKWDAVVDGPTSDDTEEFIRGLKHSLETIAGVPKLNYFEVAARPVSPSLQYAHGLPTLLRSWLQSDTWSGKSNISLLKHNGSERQFDLYTSRMLMTHQIESMINVQAV
jgi:hypothetical protein